MELLLHRGADPNIADKRGATPLHRAASRGNMKCIEALLQHSNKIDLNAQDSSGNTPLHLACEEERGDEAKLLLKHGARLDIVNKLDQTAQQMAPKGLAVILQRIADSNIN